MSIRHPQLSNKDVRELYDSTIDDKYGNDYEFRRWHRSPQGRSDYYMTREAIMRRFGNTDFSEYFEFGPGPGTWTTCFFRENPDARFTLVDISKKMARQFELEMRSASPRVAYVVSDILDFDGADKYDLFFSSRALEYIDDKSKAIEKIRELMKSGARGGIITKNPERGLRRNADSRPLHQGQISFPQLKAILEKAGFSQIQAYPAVVRVPAGRFFPECVRIAIAEALYRRVRDRALGRSRWLSRVTESYLITFIRT